ncbi:MAG: hypothetical protein HYV63_14955 [Candidatus Schekmanbacteria bacterium]|nr:hypothetical protein [Candidatus Schekmanbacteria bacterium]
MAKWFLFGASEPTDEDTAALIVRKLTRGRPADQEAGAPKLSLTAVVWILIIAALIAGIAAHLSAGGGMHMGGVSGYSNSGGATPLTGSPRPAPAAPDAN